MVSSRYRIKKKKNKKEFRYNVIRYIKNDIVKKKNKKNKKEMK